MADTVSIRLSAEDREELERTGPRVARGQAVSPTEIVVEPVAIDKGPAPADGARGL